MQKRTASHSESGKFASLRIRNSYYFLLLVLTLFLLNGCQQNSTSLSTTTPTVDVQKTNRERGEQIIAENLKREAAPYRKSRVRLTVTSEKEPTQIYVLAISRKHTEAETRTLTEIIEPKEDQDLATLTVEQKGKPTVSIAYVSSTNKFRESGTGKIFFGGLTAQELLGEWHKYDSRLLLEKELGGVKTLEVESTLKPDADSVIQRYVSVFRADNYLPIELRLFGSDGKPLRLFQIKETRPIEGRNVVWRTEIENYVYKTKVIIETLEMSFPAKLPDSYFEKDYLKSRAASKQNF